MQIVKQSKVAMQDIKRDLMDSETKMDDDITAKYEKDFIKKLKIWH
jgi:hypothetical protein